METNGSTSALRGLAAPRATDTTPAWAISRCAADIYERHLVPALYRQWTERMLDAAGVRSGARVADVACGTGVLARAAAIRAGSDGRIVGIDADKSMLDVARNADPSLGWTRASAENLPFASASFDAAVCQFGLTYFRDRVAAIHEMMRVLRPGGRLALLEWGPIEDNPGFDAETRLIERICGFELAAASKAAFSLGNIDVLRTLFRLAGYTRVPIHKHIGGVRFLSVRLWLYATIKSSPIAARLKDRQFPQLLDAADRELAAFTSRTGVVEFKTAAHLIVLQKVR